MELSLLWAAVANWLFPPIPDLVIAMNITNFTVTNNFAYIQDRIGDMHYVHPKTRMRDAAAQAIINSLDKYAWPAQFSQYKDELKNTITVDKFTPLLCTTLRNLEDEFQAKLDDTQPCYYMWEQSPQERVINKYCPQDSRCYKKSHLVPIPQLNLQMSVEFRIRYNQFNNTGSLWLVEEDNHLLNAFGQQLYKELRYFDYTEYAFLRAHRNITFHFIEY